MEQLISNSNNIKNGDRINTLYKRYWNFQKGDYVESATYSPDLCGYIVDKGVLMGMPVVALSDNCLDTDGEWVFAIGLRRVCGRHEVTQ